MNAVPFIPDTAPFTLEQRAWLNGFLAGLCSRAAGSPFPALVPTPGAEALQPVTILFGSQTGTAELLAKRAAKEAGQRGFVATVLDMAQTDLARLGSEKNLLVITSTHGDGEPPDNAKALHAALHTASQAAPASLSLTALRYSVCALGDTNYVQFCRCGKDFDAWFEKLGARRVSERADCDLDYETGFATWLKTALAALAQADRPVGAGDQAPATGPSHPIVVHIEPAAKPAYSRTQPFPATVLKIRNLNGPGSAKEVNHVELSLEGSGMAYAAGDALGVTPQNCPELVAGVLAALDCDGEEAVPTPQGEMPLRRALTECFDLGKPTAELLETVGAALRRDERLESRDKPAPTVVAIAHPLHVLDVLQCAPAKPTSAAFVAVLRKLQPRLYSIASSPKAHPGQVHLTVGAVRYELHGRVRKGVCSTFLAERAAAAGRIGVYVHANGSFRPPASGDTPMIMVGPGTGIAPFRAFLEERQATGAQGKNWLFFGDQKAGTDFLYGDELAALRSAGTLNRLDLAFSRDQPEKIYVQHRMQEQAATLYAWLEEGAHFYVCGDAARMAKDVDAALHRVIETAGGKTRDQAATYVAGLRAARRYQRDVY